MVNMDKSDKERIPIVKEVFTWPSSEPRLIASKCKACGTVSFPKIPFCGNANCSNKRDVEETLLSSRGKLLSFTLVCYPPPPPYVAPKPFVPFMLGEVAFPEGPAVIGQLVGCKYESLKIGMNAEVIVDKLYQDDQGNEVVGWKFRVH